MLEESHSLGTPKNRPLFKMVNIVGVLVGFLCLTGIAL